MKKEFFFITHHQPFAEKSFYYRLGGGCSVCDEFCGYQDNDSLRQGSNGRYGSFKLANTRLGDKLGDIRLYESGFGFGECIRDRACKRVHDKLSCTRSQNYTTGASLLYPNPDS